MKNAFRRVALVGRYQTEGLSDTLHGLVRLLSARGISVLVEQRTAEAIGPDTYDVGDFERIGDEADLAIAIGGDGTMLGVARELARREIPLVGINHGRLGFITDIGLDGLPGALGSILDGHYAAEERTLLTARVVRNQELIWTELALNDVVVNRSSRTGMIELQVHVDDQYMYSQRADGLIIATPTGSTAYALSANGPILHPQVRGIVLVPVAPQALSNRPITLPDDVTITVRVLEGREPRVAGDMQVFSDLHVGDDIIVQRAPFTTRFLHPPGYSYYTTLRSKLNWHELPILQAPR
ncbi:MAG: NAD kinase [Burkholderiales bacterium]|nr:NAD kinase [Burkholderiales bacterium]